MASGVRITGLSFSGKLLKISSFNRLVLAKCLSFYDNFIQYICCKCEQIWDCQILLCEKIRLFGFLLWWLAVPQVPAKVTIFQIFKIRTLFKTWWCHDWVNYSMERDRNKPRACPKNFMKISRGTRKISKESESDLFYHLQN